MIFNLDLTLSRALQKIIIILLDVKFPALFESGVRKRGSHLKKLL